MSRSNFAFPVNNQKSLRHFNMVENDKTSALAIFCLSSTTATLEEICKAYGRIAALVHADRCRIDPRGANRSMRTLARTMEILHTTLEYERSCRGLPKDDDFVLHVSTKYSLKETHIEEVLRDRESRQQESRKRSTQAEQSSEPRDSGIFDHGEDGEADPKQRKQEKRKCEETERAERDRAERIRKMRAERERDDRKIIW